MFICISLELQVRTGSNLETRYMVRNGRVVLGAYFQMVFSKDLAFIVTRGLQFITHLLFGPDFTVQPFGTRSVFTK